jgi:hypothetical protein
MKRYDNNVRDLRSFKGLKGREDERRLGDQRSDERNRDTLRYGKPSQSPMAENVGNINLHKGAGDDTDTQGNPNDAVPPKNRRAADINGVEWRGE